MRTKATVGSLYESKSAPARPNADLRSTYILPSVLNELVRLYPEGLGLIPNNGGRYFKGTFAEDDPRLEAILKVMADNGYRPADRGKRALPTEFGFEIRREYDESDYAAAAYMAGGSADCFVSVAYRAEATGNLQLHQGRFPKNKNFGQAYVWTVISDAGRRKLEGEYLRHLVFRPVEQTTEEGMPNVRVEGYWELTSDLILPPLSKKCILMNNDEKVFSGDYQSGCFLIEGFYTPPEIHYDARTLSSVEPFDLALTHEKFGNTEEVYPYLITSRRLYEVCKKHGLKMAGVPVRIDED